MHIFVFIYYYHIMVVIQCYSVWHILTSFGAIPHRSCTTTLLSGNKLWYVRVNSCIAYKYICTHNATARRMHVSPSRRCSAKVEPLDPQRLAVGGALGSVAPTALRVAMAPSHPPTACSTSSQPRAHSARTQYTHSAWTLCLYTHKRKQAYLNGDLVTVVTVEKQLG